MECVSGSSINYYVIQTRPLGHVELLNKQVWHFEAVENSVTKVRLVLLIKHLYFLIEVRSKN